MDGAETAPGDMEREMGITDLLGGSQDLRIRFSAW